MSIKDIVAGIQIRRSRNRMIPTAFSFPDDLRRPKHVLVCLPGNLRELTIVKQFLPMISDMFKPANITLMSMPGIKVKDIFPRKGFQILSPTTDQTTWAGLPKRSYVEALQGYKFDAVLDLSLEPTRFISGLLLNFPSALRIGKGNHLGRPFYNLEIKTKFLRDERNIYRSLLETIDLLRNSTSGSNRSAESPV